MLAIKPKYIGIEQLFKKEAVRETFYKNIRKHGTTNELYNDSQKSRVVAKP
jgi:hypothetical protein